MAIDPNNRPVRVINDDTTDQELAAGHLIPNADPPKNEAARGGFGNRKADTEDCICPQTGFVFSPVEFDHQLIDGHLFSCIKPDQFFDDFAIHGCYSVQHPFAQITRLIAVTLFNGLISPR